MNIMMGNLVFCTHRLLAIPVRSPFAAVLVAYAIPGLIVWFFLRYFAALGNFRPRSIKGKQSRSSPYCRYVLTALQMISDHLLILDREGRILFANRLPKAAIGKTLAEVINDEKFPVEKSSCLRRVMEGLELEQKTFSEIVEEGEYLIRILMQRFRNPKSDLQGVIAVCTELNRELFHTWEWQRLNQLSTFSEVASSAAHELRNPLTAIRAMAQVGTRVDLEKKNSLFQRIILEIDQLDHFLTEMTSLSKPAPPKRTPERLDKCIEGLLTLIKPRLRLQNIQLETDLDPSVPVFSFNFTLIRQALLNLVTNAIQAMEQSGTLTISTRFLPEGRAVRITVSDNGPGIPPEILANIFDPFFTTKPQGTGLGLAVTKQIIADYHKGRIWFESEMGEGTTVHIELPV